jgi:hypothetical protein
MRSGAEPSIAARPRLTNEVFPAPVAQGMSVILQLPAGRQANPVDIEGSPIAAQVDPVIAEGDKEIPWER